jgi:alpha-1,3/alpha-1,6-mannosyltransferase
MPLSTIETNCLGRLTVKHVQPPFPRSYKGKFHILFAHLRQLHLTAHLLQASSEKYDVYFVDQLSTCVPLLRTFGGTRVVFYCHFPDKLLASGEFAVTKKTSLVKKIYRLPMDMLEEKTTSMSFFLFLLKQLF